MFVHVSDKRYLKMVYKATSRQLHEFNANIIIYLYLFRVLNKL